jgi:hypothetical protein
MAPIRLRARIGAIRPRPAARPRGARSGRARQVLTRSAGPRRRGRSGRVRNPPPEIEALARTLEAGLHRDPTRPAVSKQEREARRAEDRQEAELVRLAAYAGRRQGELLEDVPVAVELGGDLRVNSLR